MKATPVLALALFGSLGVLVAAPRADVADPPPLQEAEEEEEEPPLLTAMNTLQGGLRQLRRGLRDASKRDETAALLVDMQSAALEAIAHLPAPLEPLEGDALVDWEIEFKRQMLRVADGLVRLEGAVRKGDTDGAQEIYKELGRMKKDGHDRYQ